MIKIKWVALTTTSPLFLPAFLMDPKSNKLLPLMAKYTSDVDNRNFFSYVLDMHYIGIKPLWRTCYFEWSITYTKREKKFLLFKSYFKPVFSRHPQPSPKLPHLNTSYLEIVARRGFKCSCTKTKHKNLKHIQQTFWFLNLFPYQRGSFLFDAICDIIHQLKFYNKI